MSLRSEVLTLYRRMLRTARTHAPPDWREKTVQDVRSAFRSNRDVRDEQQIRQLMHHGESRMAFVRVTRRGAAGSASHGGHKHYVHRGGKLVEGHGTPAGMTGEGRRDIDPEAYQRHIKLLRRQHFLDR